MKPGTIELIARGVLLRGDRVLLCENTTTGVHYLPGGHVEPGESASLALQRELLEETGCTASPTAPIVIEEHVFTQSNRPRHEINVVFHVAHELPNTVASRETSLRFVWHPINTLDSLLFKPRSHIKIVQRASDTNPSLAWISTIENTRD